METKMYTFVESVDDVRSVCVKKEDGEDAEFISIEWIKRNGTFEIRSKIKLTIEAIVATHKMLGEFLVDEAMHELLTEIEESLEKTRK